jgi:hypothetical protein
MSILAKDTFVEASTIDLSAHTADVGGGWTAAAGAIQVIAGTGLAEDQNSSSGNRYNLTTGLGSGVPIEVSLNVTVTDLSTQFPGIAARRTSAASGGTGYEFRYLSGQWNLTDQTTTVVLTEAWDGSLRTLKLHVEDNLVIGYVNGVEKCRMTNNVWPAGTFAGLLLANFSGTEFQLSAANFEVDSVASLLTPTNDDGAPHLLHRPVRDDTIVTVFM